jgi:hypothetical protein
MTPLRLLPIAFATAHTGGGSARRLGGTAWRSLYGGVIGLEAARGGRYHPCWSRSGWYRPVGSARDIVHLKSRWTVMM